MTTPLLEVADLGVHYGDAIALEGVSFSLGTNQALAVLGSNGSGKSTLARALTGLVPASAGTITLAGVDVTSKPAHTIRRAGMIHLPEGRGVFRGLTVLENLRMGLTVDKSAGAEGIERAIEIFPVLGQRKRQLAGTLSGGEQQMLSLARALMVRPSVVIADEMSLGLAPKMVDVVFEGLQRALDTGSSVIMIEQFAGRALAFADRAIILQRGSLVWSGSADTAGDELVRSYLGEGAVA